MGEGATKELVEGNKGAVEANRGLRASNSYRLVFIAFAFRGDTQSSIAWKKDKRDITLGAVIQVRVSHRIDVRAVF